MMVLGGGGRFLMSEVPLYLCTARTALALERSAYMDTSCAGNLSLRIQRLLEIKDTHRP